MGVAIPGVNVTVTNTGTNISRSVVSNESKNYIFTEMNVGAYSITGELPGFKKVVVTGVQLNMDQRLRTNLTLQVGEISDKVEITTELQLVTSDNTSVKTVVENRRMVELPLNKRDFLYLALLVPDAMPTFAGSNL